MCERWKKEKVAKQTDVEAEIATLGVSDGGKWKRDDN